MEMGILKIFTWKWEGVRRKAKCGFVYGGEGGLPYYIKVFLEIPHDAA